MYNIEVNVISTGSTGNAIFLDGQVLVDCGVPFSKLAESGVVDRVKYIYLTHQHRDHINVATLKKILTNRPTVRIIYPQYLVNFFADCFSYDCSFLIQKSFISSITKWYKIGNITFSCVPLHHDVPNVAWKIHFSTPQGIYKVIYATDTASMDGVIAKDYNLYLIEANYDKEDMVQRIKEKRMTGQYIYEDRVLKTHLSKQKADDFIYENIGRNGAYMYLHGHEDKKDNE